MNRFGVKLILSIVSFLAVNIWLIGKGVAKGAADFFISATVEETILFIILQLLVVLIYFIWCMLSRQLDDSKAAWTVGNSMTFLGYVMMGDLIKNKITVKNNKKGLLMCLLGIALLAIDYFILFVRVQHGDIYYNKWLSLYAAPLVILGSILVFSGGGNA